MTDEIAEQLGLGPVVETVEDAYIHAWVGPDDRMLFATALRWDDPQDAARMWQSWEAESARHAVEHFDVHDSRPSSSAIVEVDDRRVFEVMMAGDEFVVMMHLVVPRADSQEPSSGFLDLVARQMDALPEPVEVVSDADPYDWGRAPPDWERIPIWSLAAGPVFVSVLFAGVVGLGRRLVRRRPHPRPIQGALSSLAIGSIWGGASALSNQDGSGTLFVLAATDRHMATYTALGVVFAVAWFWSVLRAQNKDDQDQQTIQPSAARGDPSGAGGDPVRRHDRPDRAG